MKAMVFAAGLGTRLRPITDSIPKALVEVAGKPALEHVLLKLKSAGVGEVVVNIHHFPDLVRSFLRSNSNFGLDIHVSDESRLLLDTGGGLLAARRWLDGSEPIIVHNADILSDFPLQPMVAAHERSAADATLLSQPRISSRRFLYDASGRLRGWGRSDGSQTIPEGLDPEGLVPLAFGGVSVVSPTIFVYLQLYSQSSGEVFSTTPFYASNTNALNIRAYVPAEPYRWFDIGKPQTLGAARASFAGGGQ